MSKQSEYVQNFFLTIIVICLVLMAVVYLFVKQSSPLYHGQIRTEQIDDSVNVIFGPYGIPHIYANSESDGYYTLGFLHAQERLFQMEVLRRAGAGKLAEIFGEELVLVDHFFRSINMEAHAISSSKKMRSSDNLNLKLTIDSYLNGVNEYISRGTYPPEFRLLGIEVDSFTVKDMYLIAAYMSFSFTEAMKTDPNLSMIRDQLGKRHLVALGLDTLKDKNGVNRSISDSAHSTFKLAHIEELLPMGIWTGSNAIVIGPAKSASGKVLFENDTHIGFQQPAIWYEAHVVTPEHEVYGNYLAGLPFPMVGHNRSLTWGLTMFENDDLNLYEVQSIDSSKYVYKGERKNFEQREEVIKVRSKKDTVVIIRSTVHGPVVSDMLEEWKGTTSSRAISLWWLYTNVEGDALEVLYNFSIATHMDEFRSAVKKIASPGLNVLYGDTAGNIACWSAGKIPIHRDGLVTRMILDGSSGEDDIIGFHDFSKNPQVENPESGYIVSANQNPHSKLIDINGYYAPHDRYLRLESIIGSRDELTVGDLKAISMDNISIYQKKIADTISSVILSSDLYNEFDDKESAALKHLQNWGGKHDLIDIAPIIYYRTLSNILTHTLEDELGQERYNIFVNTHFFKNQCLSFISNNEHIWWDNVSTDQNENREQVVVNAFRKSVEELADLFGSNLKNWTWGGLHTLEHEHPIGKKQPFNHILNVGPFQSVGGIETVNNASFELKSNGRLKVKYGPAMRIILDMGNPSIGWSIIPTGQSGHFLSPHYSDQAEMFNSGKFRYMTMDLDIIKESSNNTLRFYPLK